MSFPDMHVGDALPLDFDFSELLDADDKIDPNKMEVAVANWPQSTGQDNDPSHILTGDPQLYADKHVLQEVTVDKAQTYGFTVTVGTTKGRTYVRNDFVTILPQVF